MFLFNITELIHQETIIMTAFSLLSPKEAKSLLDEQKGVLIDIRTVGEAVSEFLPGSLFLPFDLVNKQRLEDLGVADKTPILVCRSDVRARQAAETLAQEMDGVTVLDGGITQWKASNLPVNQGHKAIPLDRQVLVGAGSMMFLFTVLGFLISPYFFALNIFMAGGMVFAGLTGACGMARILIMMPWNKSPICGASCSTSKPV